MSGTGRIFFRHFYIQFCAALLLAGTLSGCSTNPATGRQQFTALMPAAQEVRVGAEEHAKVMQEYGIPSDSADLQAYIGRIGAAVAKNTERADVQYKFFLLDDPMVNAFALPGGYVYITRGLLAQANSEAELAAVLGHEIGHVTGRHAAARYSRGVVASLGAAALSAALDSGAASQALGVGTDLYLKSYSRGQESEADGLGMRYMTRAGYDPQAMVAFLRDLESSTALDARMNGQAAPRSDWFSTHPLTTERVQAAAAQAAQYPRSGPHSGEVRRDAFLRMTDGLVYGDSARQGFIRGRSFYHTQMGFTFTVPDGFHLQNQTQQVVATSKAGGVILFDATPNPKGDDALTYLVRDWMKGDAPPDAERITINGMDAATASFPGTVGKTPAIIRIVAVTWKPGRVFRFQMAIPKGAPAALVDDLKRATYSLRALSEAERRDIRPYRLRLVTAGPGDSVAGLAARMQPADGFREDRFRVLNGLAPGAPLAAGRLYKIVTDR